MDYPSLTKTPPEGGINKSNSSLENKYMINFGFYDCPGSNIKELTENLANYALSHGLTLWKSGIIMGGWQGKQYGTTIITYLDYMINVIFIGSGNIIMGFIDVNSHQCVNAWAVTMSTASIT